MSKKRVKVLSLIAKAGLTAGLFIFLSSVIMRDYKKVRAVLPKQISLSDFRVDPDEVQSRARTKTLNQLMPSFDYLAEFEKGRRGLNEKRLHQYARYYKKVVEYLPGRAGAYSMLGFCYYHLGENEKAILSYKKAIALNPHFFWSQYNLAVIFFKSGRYEKSLKAVQEAVAIRPGPTLLFIRSSKIYQDIFRESGYSTELLQEKLKAGYRDGRLLLGLSRYYLGNPAKISSGILKKDEIKVRIF